MHVRNEYKILIRQPEGKRPLRRPRCRWNDNIKMHLKRNRVEGCVLDSSEDRGQWQALVNMVMNFWVP
jgi:hypothetical protein